MASIKKLTSQIRDTLFPSYFRNPFTPVIERDSKGKLSTSRMLRTSLPKKFKDAHTVFYGTIWLRDSIAMSVPLGLLNLRDEDEPLFDIQFNDKPFATLHSHHIRTQYTAGILGILFSPLDMLQSLVYVALNLLLRFVTLPFRAINKLMNKLVRSTDNKVLHAIFKVLNVLFGAGPVVILDILLRLSNLALTAAIQVTKYSLAVVLTIAAAPIITIVGIISMIKSLPLFRAARKVKLQTMIKAKQLDTFTLAKESDQQQLKNTASLLSILRRDEYNPRYSGTDGIRIHTYKKSFKPKDRGGKIEDYLLHKNELIANPDAALALKKLNMFGMNNKDFDNWCSDNGIWLESSTQFKS